jgi:hypothetical protein
LPAKFNDKPAGDRVFAEQKTYAYRLTMKQRNKVAEEPISKTKEHHQATGEARLT